MNQQAKEKVKARHEIDPQYQWDTAKIYSQESLWEQDLDKIRALLPQAAEFQGRLGEGAEIFLDFLNYQEELSRLADKAYLYASMKKDEDNTQSRYQDMKDRVLGLLVEAQSALAFFEPELLALPPEQVEEYLQNPQITVYEKYLGDILRLRPHTLSKEEEKLLSLSGEMAASFDNIYSMLCHADMEFPLITNEEGEEERLTHGNYIRFLESGQRDVRKQAYYALYDTYGRQINTLAAIYASSVKKDTYYARVRNYTSALAASLFADNVPPAVYEKLIIAVHENLPLFWRYLKLRKRVMQLDELKMYDVYMPLFASGERRYSYEEAAELVKAGLSPLGEEYVGIIAKGLESGWVDVYENTGKTPGAYSSGVYGTDPYILLNFQGNLNSVFTLAHELGHSLHSYYSHQHQPYIYAYYKIFVAEVASTVNETLLSDYMLKKAETKGEKIAILNHYLEQFRGTVFRQTMFAEFEKLTHGEIEAGRTLTAEKLNELYGSLNRRYFGEEIEVDEQIMREWARIPHFYRAFYVYKYATGFAAAQALAADLLDPDPARAQAAQERYLRFLSAGNSLEPIEALRQAGVDMTTDAPVKAAMAIFEERLAMLSELV